MPIRRLAVTAALLAAPASVAAQTQTCPTNARNGVSSDIPMLPTVVSYAVTRASGSPGERERERESHEVVVIGGHATEGDFRIDMRLSADVPSDCDLRVEIFDPNLSPQRRREGNYGVAARVLPRREYMQIRNAHTTGSNRLAVQVRTLAAFGNSIEGLAFTIGDPKLIVTPPAYGFTVQRRPIGDYAVTASMERAPAGADVTVTATMPAGLSDDAFAEPVTFTVDPPGAGAFRNIGRSGTSQRGAVEVNTALSPQRAQIIFEPAQLQQPRDAQIIAYVAGNSRSIPITVLSGPAIAGTGAAISAPSSTVAACAPAAEYQRVAGGIELTITNTGDKACPAYRAEMRKGKAAYFDAKDVPALTPVQNAKSAAALRSATIPAAGTTSGWTGIFQLSDANLPVGTVVTTRLVPLTPVGTAIELESFTVPVMRGTIPNRN